MKTVHLLCKRMMHAILYWNPLLFVGSAIESITLVTSWMILFSKLWKGSIYNYMPMAWVCEHCATNFTSMVTCTGLYNYYGTHYAPSQHKALSAMAHCTSFASRLETVLWRPCIILYTSWRSRVTTRMCTTCYYLIATNHEYAKSAELVHAKKSQSRSLADSLGSVMCQSSYLTFCSHWNILKKPPGIRRENKILHQCLL